MSNLLPEGYNNFIIELKTRIQTSQVRAALAVSKELNELYWDMGHAIDGAINQNQWGTSVLVSIAKDLKAAFPGIAGFSKRNLYRMRAFYLAYKDLSEIVPQAVAQLP